MPLLTDIKIKHLSVEPHSGRLDFVAHARAGECRLTVVSHTAGAANISPQLRKAAAEKRIREMLRQQPVA